MLNGEVGYVELEAVGTSQTLTLPVRCYHVQVINDGPGDARFRLFDTSGTPAAASATSGLIKAGEVLEFTYHRAAGVNSLGFWTTLTYWAAETAFLRVYSQ